MLSIVTQVKTINKKDDSFREEVVESDEEEVEPQYNSMHGEFLKGLQSFYKTLHESISFSS